MSESRYIRGTAVKSERDEVCGSELVSFPRVVLADGTVFECSKIRDTFTNGSAILLAVAYREFNDTFENAISAAAAECLSTMAKIVRQIDKKQICPICGGKDHLPTCDVLHVMSYLMP